jgi:hypothetical protein
MRENMLKKLTNLIALLCVINVSAQEDPASAVAISLQDYLQITYDGQACSSTSGTLGASDSGEPACAGISSDDVWYSFTATSQAVKVVGVTVNFDMVLQVIDAGTMVSIACQNTNGASSGEVLYVNTLQPGGNYFVRVHSSDGAGAGAFDLCAQYLPSAEVRNGWYPTFSPDDGLPGYKINQTINRTTYTPYNGLIEGTRWLFVDAGNGDTFTNDIIGSNGVMSLNSVNGLCFNKTYDVYAQVQVDGYWCGYNLARQIFTEAEPVTELEPAYPGMNYNLDGEIKARFVGSEQNLEWRLTTDNGTTVLYHQGASSTSFCYLDLVDCIRYNRIYIVEIRAEYCGFWGSWSDPEFIIINPIPYVNLREEYCETTQYPGATLQCEFLEVVDQYAWQLSPVDPTDPTMTPIGPAIVTYSVNTTALYLLPLGVEFGTTYRVGVKPMLGTTDTCNSEQEGDYGFFCLVTIGVPAELSDWDGGTLAPEDTNYGFNESNLTVYPNPVPNGYASVFVADKSLNGNALIQVYNIAGSLVSEKQFFSVENANVLQFEVPSEVKGKYIVVLSGADYSYSMPIIVN